VSVVSLTTGTQLTTPKRNVPVGLRRNSGKLIYGVGIADRHAAIAGVVTPWYRAWSNMLARCYSQTYSAKHTTYIGCSVCAEWHKLSNFKKWFDKNYVQGYHLDKDILVPGNKIYSPRTCCYIPQVLNSIFSDSGATRGSCAIGVYYDKHRNNFQAYMRNGIQRVRFGRYPTEAEAHSVWLSAKRKHVKTTADRLLATHAITPKIYKAVLRKLALLT